MTRVSRAGFLLAVVGGFLAVSPRLADSYVLPKLLALSVGGLLAWLGLFRARLRKTALDAPLATLWAVIILSFLFSTDRWISAVGMYPQAFHGILPLGLCTALFYAAAAHGADPEAADWLTGAIVAASIPVSLYGIVQKLGGDPLLHFELPQGRITSSIGSPVMLGACLALMLPPALHRALDRKSATGAAAAGLLAVALVLTQARGAWLGAAAGAGLYLWLGGRLRPRAARALGAAAAVGLVAAALALGGMKRSYDSARLELWRSAAAAFGSRPLLGYGPDNFRVALRAHKSDGFLRAARRTDLLQDSAHDDLIQAAVTLGALGLAAYLWLLGALAARIRRLLAKAADARVAALAAGLGGLLVAAKVNPVPISALALAAILAGLLASDEGPPLERAASRAACGLAALFCAACAVAVCRLGQADAVFNRGRAELAVAAVTDPAFKDGIDSLRRASELNPSQMEYVTARCDTIFRLSALVPPEKGREFLDKALGLARDAARRHPSDPSAHEMAATALMLKSKLGADTLRDAQAEIGAASALDPTSMFILQRRLEIARALGDRADFERTSETYQRVITLTGQGPHWVPLLPPPAPTR